MTIIEQRTMNIICSSLPVIAKSLETIANNMDAKTCCICGKKFNGYGNNPSPVNDEGVCCDECNINVVVPARIKKMKGE